MSDEPRLLTASDVRRLLDEGGLSARRSLGQNFVIDPNTIRRIVRLARVGPGDRVLEVGPGLGSLTLGLVASGAEVTVVEKDERLATILGTVVPDEVRVVVGDALEVDLAPLVDPGPTVLVANLPYNVATPLVLRVLAEVPAVARLLVMVQREVGERMVAPPGSKTYGIPSLLVAQHATGKVVGTVSAEVFHPKPNVTSALVELVRRPSPAVSPTDEAFMWRLVRTSFGQRRKTLRRSLDGLVGPDDLLAAGIDGDIRPEQLGLDTFAALADAATP